MPGADAAEFERAVFLVIEGQLVPQTQGQRQLPANRYRSAGLQDDAYVVVGEGRRGIRGTVAGVLHFFIGQGIGDYVVYGI